MKPWLLVAAGGAAGSVLRYAVQRLLPAYSFPYNTFAVNLAGCLLIGILWGLLLKGSLGNDGRLLLMTGLCGGFTTFSAFSLESLQLLQQGRMVQFFFYVVLSVALGLLATLIGYKLLH
ncbi:fluoride efflux transporter CrcB [Pseudocnuella soli]|uniref:fluoride efflux transporter CrcB n=1 Tax=Pseudocnuella soli TaxID=2502779 RepID=UPI001045EE47|nr:fluoride efflux transporter CrcB [Pseudocnuella soli]